MVVSYGIDPNKYCFDLNMVRSINKSKNAQTQNSIKQPVVQQPVKQVPTQQTPVKQADSKPQKLNATAIIKYIYDNLNGLNPTETAKKLGISVTAVNCLTKYVIDNIDTLIRKFESQGQTQIINK